MNSEINEKIEELKILESNLQSILTQRQMIQMELNEIENALSELEDYDDEIYKMVSGLMLKAKKEDLVEELEEKKNAANVKIESIERQEALIDKKASEIRGEIDELSEDSAKKKN